MGFERVEPESSPASLARVASALGGWTECKRMDAMIFRTGGGEYGRCH